MVMSSQIFDQIAADMANEIAKDIDRGVYVSMISNWPERPNGDLPYGWAGELTYANTMGFDAHFELYKDMVEFINQHVKNPKENCFWNKIGDCIYIQFRKSKDMTWFVLRFGL